MTTVTDVTFDDLDNLRSAMTALREMGHAIEAARMEELHAKLTGVLVMHELATDEESDSAFVADMEEAERDFAAGVWLPNEDVTHRLNLSL